MGTRQRIRVAPSGIPAKGGDGEPNLLGILQSTLFEEDLVQGVPEDLVTVELTLEADEAVLLYYRANVTSVGSGTFTLRMRRDGSNLDSSVPGDMGAGESRTISSFVMDNPGPGTYEYIVEGEASATAFTASDIRLLIEIVRASIIG